MNWGTVGDVKRQIRDFEADATNVALRPVHANGDYARDDMLKVMADL